MFTVEPLLKDALEIRSLLLCPKYAEFTPEMRTLLYLYQVPKVSTLEGFHCILIPTHMALGEQ